jgi:hypothetical protein
MDKLTSVFQVLVGSVLIGIGMTVSATPLGGYAVLPLIGIVPILFGLYGVQSPMCRLVTKAVNSVRKQNAAVLGSKRQPAVIA